MIQIKRTESIKFFQTLILQNIPFLPYFHSHSSKLILVTGKKRRKVDENVFHVTSNILKKHGGARLVVSIEKAGVPCAGAFSNGIGMLTSGWRGASFLVISQREEVTVPISYKRFSANCLHYVQLSARMKEDIFSGEGG